MAFAWRPLVAMRGAVALESARIAADDPRHFAMRLSTGDGSVAARVASWLPDPRKNGPLQAGADLSARKGDVQGDDAARLRGVAHFLAGDYKQASMAFVSIRTRTARDWNDLAAAELALARHTGREEHVIEALTAADHALALDPKLIEAGFNRALATQQIGAVPAASAQWQHYSEGDAWAAVARQRQQAPTPDRIAWGKHDPSCVSVDEIRQLTNRFPQYGRLTAESILLSTWAEAMTGNEHEAQRQLQLARAIGEVLSSRGESLVTDAVRAIDEATGTPRLQRLVAGHLAYREGRYALRDNDVVAAERHLLEARAHLAAGGSPMAAVAENYAATAIANQDRTTEALNLLKRLRASAPPGHRAHLGRIHHEIANLEGILGHWSEAISAATQSIAISSSLRERGLAAATEATLSELYDFTGSRELAWKHGSAALRGACAAGDYDRARVALAALTRTEMRGRRWYRARSLASVESELVPFHRDERLNAGMFLRIAAIESNVGRREAATRAVTEARAAAKKLPRGSAREKLLADIDGAAGAMERRHKPTDAITLLSSAIHFQQQAERPIVLPELYLERGRAYIGVGDLDAAADDFEKGIRELERQRERVRDTELRPGIFDDAFELFEEAVSLRIERGESAAAVLKDVERGRARAVLEQVAAYDKTLITPGDLRDVQRHLAAETALIEYISLPDRLTILVIQPSHVTMRTVQVSRESLGSSVTDFLRDVEVPAHGVRLHDMLIRPISSDIRNVRAITFVVPDILQRVPFAALRDTFSGSFLIQQYAPAMAPSAGVFIATVRRLQRLPQAAPVSIGVFANPTIPRDVFPLLPSLHTSEYEARAVSKHYRKRDVFTRDAATAQHFLQDAPSYDIIHYAGHATVNRYEPGASSLVCASTPRLHGAVTLRQIAAMKFRSTRAVVLAACRTMDGRNAAIEGVPSLARAFLVAGVPAVVGTLWDVEDSEAAAIVRPLHEHLARGAKPADALRAAQLEAIRAGLPVRQWAAFALTGAAR